MRICGDYTGDLGVQQDMEVVSCILEIRSGSTASFSVLNGALGPPYIRSTPSV
jgi:hypothetical protein